MRYARAWCAFRLFLPNHKKGARFGDIGASFTVAETIPKMT